MKAEVIANRLNGRCYGDETTREIELEAKNQGIVIIFGASDDMVEFRGAINDEIGIDDFLIDDQGILRHFDYMRDEFRHMREHEVAEYFRRKPFAREVMPICHEHEGWRFDTEIPHATFDIFDGDDLYCRGIVLRLKDTVKVAADSEDTRAGHMIKSI